MISISLFFSPTAMRIGRFHFRSVTPCSLIAILYL